MLVLFSVTTEHSCSCSSEALPRHSRRLQRRSLSRSDGGHRMPISKVRIIVHRCASPRIPVQVRSDLAHAQAELRVKEQELHATKTDLATCLSRASKCLAKRADVEKALRWCLRNGPNLTSLRSARSSADSCHPCTLIQPAAPPCRSWRRVLGNSPRRRRNCWENWPKKIGCYAQAVREPGLASTSVCLVFLTFHFFYCFSILLLACCWLVVLFPAFAILGLGSLLLLLRGCSFLLLLPALRF